METTLYINADILEKINYAARIRRTSRSDMIVMLLREVMNDMPDPAGAGKMVQYQKKGKAEDWYRFHVNLRMDEYEYFLDVRRLLKMSVSLILAYAVNKYLKQLMNTINTDNYQHKNYILAKTVIDNIVCWKLIWGFPPNLKKLITL